MVILIKSNLVDMVPHYLKPLSKPSREQIQTVFKKLEEVTKPFFLIKEANRTLTNVMEYQINFFLTSIHILLGLCQKRRSP
jgi:hypothetical protein